MRQPLTYRRAWRRAERIIHPVPLEPIYARIDQAKLAAIQAQYAGLERALRQVRGREALAAAEHCSRAGFEAAPLRSRKSVLDLGCGGGFFLFVLQHLKHACLGLDIDEFPLFTQLLELFGIERRVWTIRPFEPLPDLGRKFDLVTAFSIDFNRVSKQDWWWGPPEWAFFLDDLKRHLNPGGRIFLGLNPGKNKEFYTPELRDFFLSRGASVERENVLFPPQPREIAAS